MRLDKQDIFPVAVILIFALAIPLATWLGLGSRQEIVGDLSSLIRTFTFVSVGFAIFIAWGAISLRKREKRFLTERGEQRRSDFAALFAIESEQRAANLLFDRLRRMTGTNRMPRLEKEDSLNGPPLFLCPEDLAEQIEDLCDELDICTALDPDARSCLYSATTVSQLVSALARFVEHQAVKDVHDESLA